LRIEATTPERILWDMLRGKRAGGLRFRRQHPLANYIVDFFCGTAKLVIEIDGEVHATTVEEDRRRQRDLEQLGYHVIRFSNLQVLRDPAAVVRDILRNCSARASSVSPRQRSGTK
jgi:very-short-patch-repair endonuclease